MYFVKGKIHAIIPVNDKKYYIVLQKMQSGKKTLLAAEVYGYWKQKADEMKLKKGDKISARLYIKSTPIKDRFYHDLSFKAIELVAQPQPKKKDGLLFDDDIIGEKHIYDENGNILL